MCVCVCVESGGEFDFGILINIAFTVQLNVAGSRRVHMMVPHEAEQGHSNYARLIINTKHTTHTDPKCLSSNYKRHLVAATNETMTCENRVGNVSELPECGTIVGYMWN